MTTFGKELAEGLEEFLEQLRSGDPIEVTEARIVNTPDGPTLVRRKAVIHGQQTNRGSEGEVSNLLS